MNLQENTRRIKEIMVLVEQNWTKTILKHLKKNPDPNAEILKDVDPLLKRIFYNVQSEYGSPLKVTYGKRSIDQNKSAGGV
jgi:hypothetical protein